MASFSVNPNLNDKIDKIVDVWEQACKAPAYLNLKDRVTDVVLRLAGDEILFPDKTKKHNRGYQNLANYKKLVTMREDINKSANEVNMVSDADYNTFRQGVIPMRKVPDVDTDRTTSFLGAEDNIDRKWYAEAWWSNYSKLNALIGASPAKVLLMAEEGVLPNIPTISSEQEKVWKEEAKSRDEKLDKTSYIVSDSKFRWQKGLKDRFNEAIIKLDIVDVVIQITRDELLREICIDEDDFKSFLKEVEVQESTYNIA